MRLIPTLDFWTLFLWSIITLQSVQAQNYIIIGVSGGLQDGFPDHKNLDWHAGQEDEVQAVFLGRALVRGYKAYLDVMEHGWRQYTPEPEQPLINCNVIPSGCWFHANEYWMYLVDTRQFTAVLMNEPRFLSITPDLGLVDLQAEETGPLVKHIAHYQARIQNKSDTTAVAFPIVTGAWYNPSSHVLSPILYIKEDGTQVTNFPQSLAKWAGVDVESSKETSCQVLDTEIYCGQENRGQYHQQEYWDSVRRAIRHAEQNRLLDSQTEAHAPTGFKCERKARFGVSPNQARVNYPFSQQEVSDMLKDGGFEIDFELASVKNVK